MNSIKLKESERIYTFHNNGAIKLKNVRAVTINEDGTHNVDTADGKTHIISAGWLSIQISNIDKGDN